MIRVIFSLGLVVLSATSPSAFDLLAQNSSGAGKDVKGVVVVHTPYEKKVQQARALATQQATDLVRQCDLNLKAYADQIQTLNRNHAQILSQRSSLQTTIQSFSEVHKTVEMNLQLLTEVRTTLVRELPLFIKTLRLRLIEQDEQIDVLIRELTEKKVDPNSDEGRWVETEIRILRDLALFTSAAGSRINAEEVLTKILDSETPVEECLKWAEEKNNIKLSQSFLALQLLKWAKESEHSIKADDQRLTKISAELSHLQTMIERNLADLQTQYTWLASQIESLEKQLTSLTDAVTKEEASCSKYRKHLLRLQTPVILSWSFAGPIDGLHCLLINEPSDPAWSDNYLCSTHEWDWKWVWGGALPRDYACTQIKEPSEKPHWHDNYLCVRNSDPYMKPWISFGFSFRGKASRQSVQMNEPSAKEYWRDNYLYWSLEY